MQIEVGKKDLFLIVVLSLIFFGMSVSNLGLIAIPATSWKASGGETIMLTLESNQTITSIYVLIQGYGTLQYRLYGVQSGDWKFISFVKETSSAASTNIRREASSALLTKLIE